MPFTEGREEMNQERSSKNKWKERKRSPFSISWNPHSPPISAVESFFTLKRTNSLAALAYENSLSKQDREAARKPLERGKRPQPPLGSVPQAPVLRCAHFMGTRSCLTAVQLLQRRT